MIDHRRLMQLQSALTKSGGRHDIENVIRNLENGHAQVWETEHSTVVTQVVDYDTYRSLNVWLAGGEMDDIIELLEEGEEWARMCGCSVLEVTGRRGWKRVLAPFGFREEAVVLTKDI